MKVSRWRDRRTVSSLKMKKQFKRSEFSLFGKILISCLFINRETVAKVTPTTTPQKIQIPFITLAREGIRFHSSPSPGSSPLRGAGAKATPTNPAMKGPGGSGGGLGGLFAPHRPSPLSHSFTSSQSPSRSSPLSRQATSHTTTVQLVGRPETSLSGGLGRPKTSSLSRKINEPSATMVPVLALSQTEEEGGGKDGGRGRRKFTSCRLQPRWRPEGGLQLNLCSTLPWRDRRERTSPVVAEEEEVVVEGVSFVFLLGR